MAKRLETLSSEQFGSRARAYVTSAVHSSGQDLDWIEAHLANQGKLNFLDVGCGGGHVSYRAARHVVSVIAADPSVEMLRAVETAASEQGINNLTTIVGSAERLPYEDGVFDAAATRFSAHHWKDLNLGLLEIARALKNGGQLLIVDSASPAKPILDTHLQAIEVLRDPSHVRNYSLAEWTAAVGRAGFVIGEARTARVRIEFQLWAERMKTPDDAIAAVRRVQTLASEEVGQHFEIADDGSFFLDTVWIAATKH